jgi:hypothetical protein
MKCLLGVVGYQFLRDHSVGPTLYPDLQRMAWPDGVSLDEMHWSPLAIAWNFQDMPEPYQRVVLLTASDLGKPVGTVSWRRWMGGLPGPEQIQECVNEAATGVISLANLLVIGEHFKIWPDELIVIDAQPGVEEAGEEFTPEFALNVPEIIEALRAAVQLPLRELPDMEPLYGEQIVLHGYRYTFSQWRSDSPPRTG